MDILVNYYNVPRVCKECGGVLIYKGVGEYHCEVCGQIDYDDYGKVRLYIEKHHGATAAEIEDAIGVSQKTIRQLLRDSRIEIAEGSKSFLHCEVCNKSIRSGRYCVECETKLHRNIEAQERERLFIEMQSKGFGAQRNTDEGHRRFMRNK
uniref:hypothetical protein n=1 Tax=Acetatifactor sp. TaxID=1872090 RepID=UPI00405794FE